MILLFYVFILGITLTMIYNNYNPITEEVIINRCLTQARINGVWLSDIKQLSNYSGRYICVNIDETKTLKELNRICSHEVGHEIFARYCEKNFTKCLEVAD